MRNQNVVRSSIKVTNGEYSRLRRLSEMLGVSMGGIVSMVLTDGFIRYKSRIIRSEVSNRRRPNALREENEEETHVIKFTIAWDIYIAIQDWEYGENRSSVPRVTIKNLFSSWFDWYCDNAFKLLLYSYDELKVNKCKENAVNNFYENKSNYYGVPLSSLKSFYLAELLNTLLMCERSVNFEMKVEKYNTKFFLNPTDIEWE